jgi:hypothetical protein
MEEQVGKQHQPHFFWDQHELFLNAPGLHEFCTKQVAAQKPCGIHRKNVRAIWGFCSILVQILQEHLRHHTVTDKNFGITQPERLVKTLDVACRKGNPGHHHAGNAQSAAIRSAALTVCHCEKFCAMH